MANTIIHYLLLFTVLETAHINTLPLNHHDNEKELPHRRNTLSYLRSRLWHHGIVPYLIDDTSSYGRTEIKIIQDTIKYMTNVADTVEFVDYTAKEKIPNAYLLITSEKEGCYSNVGHNKSVPVQKLNLYHNRFTGSCIEPHIIKHELMHALGFNHQHARRNRDDYIKINLENIKKGKEQNFDIEEDSFDFGMEYDPFSIMHYTNNQFSKNGKPTIVYRSAPDVKLGGVTLSSTDKNLLKQLYSKEHSERLKAENEKSAEKSKIEEKQTEKSTDLHMSGTLNTSSADINTNTTHSEDKNKNAKSSIIFQYKNNTVVDTYTTRIANKINDGNVNSSNVKNKGTYKAIPTVVNKKRHQVIK